MLVLEYALKFSDSIKPWLTEQMNFNFDYNYNYNYNGNDNGKGDGTGTGQVFNAL